MKKIVVLLLSILIAPITVANHHSKNESKHADKMGRHFLLDPQDCKDTKDGVGRMLLIADDLFDEIKTQGDDKNKKWNKEKWAKAAFFSELAANYSTVYQVWCKHHGHKKRMSKD
jgi:hypothetical protein